MLAAAKLAKPDWFLPADWPRYTTPEYYSWTMKGLPNDAIVANWAEHAPHNSHSPLFWYQDVVCICRDCGARFVFSKEEQRIWYEEYKLPVYARAVRCLACRRQLRQKNGQPRA